MAAGGGPASELIMFMVAVLVAGGASRGGTGLCNHRHS